MGDGPGYAVRAALVGAALCAGACSSAPPPPPGVGVMTEAGAYQLSAEEKALDCKKLTGRMQVRILQIRDHDQTARGTLAARGVQSATTALLGTSRYGASTQAQYARDRAVLEAYNNELKARNCAAFDLEAELKPKPVTATPAPVPKGDDGKGKPKS